MSKQFHSDVFDKGLSEIKNHCNKIIMTNGVPSVDNYAACVSLKSAEVTVASGDFVLADNGAARKVTHGAKQGSVTTTTNGSADAHFAYLDTVNERVLVVTDEDTNQSLFQGNPMTFPSLTYSFGAPT